MAKLLSGYCKNFSKLYQGQIRAQKNPYTIDVIASLVPKVESCWAEKKSVVTLFMNIKGAFNYISRIRLAKKMIELGINGDLI